MSLTLDETLDMLAEYTDIDLPYVDVVYSWTVWHEDGSSSWEKIPEGVWGIRYPTLDGRDAIVGSTFKRFPEHWNNEMRRRAAASRRPERNDHEEEPF